MVIVSRNNALVKELASLKEKKFRKERGAFLVEGGKMVRECAASGLEIMRLIVREDYGGETFSLPAVRLGADAFRAVCDEKTPQGIVAEVALSASTARRLLSVSRRGFRSRQRRRNCSFGGRRGVSGNLLCRLRRSVFAQECPCQYERRILCPNHGRHAGRNFRRVERSFHDRGGYVGGKRVFL